LCILVLCGTITMVASVTRQNYYSSLKVHYYYRGQTRDFIYQHIGLDFKKAYCNGLSGAVVGHEMIVIPDGCANIYSHN